MKTSNEQSDRSDNDDNDIDSNSGLTSGTNGDDPIETNLQKCFAQVIQPVNVFLCLLGWRPFPIFINRDHCCYRFLDVLYVLLVFFFLAVSYFFGLYYSTQAGRISLISEYLVETVVSFILWLYGMWYYRREEGKAFEELSALIETVYLYISVSQGEQLLQNKLTKTLTKYLICAVFTLILYLGFALWLATTVVIQISSSSTTTTQFVLSILVLAVGYVAEHAVYLAVIILYWVLCKLHEEYLTSLRDRLMKRNIGLNKAIRDISTIKKLINDNNQGWAMAISFLAFSLGTQAVLVQVRFFEGEQYQYEFTQAGVSFLLLVALFFAALFPATMVSWGGDRLGSVAWKIRAEQHYQKATLQQLDSFLQFCSNTKLYAKVMGFPIWKEYLVLMAGIVLVAVFFLWRIGAYSND